MTDDGVGWRQRLGQIRRFFLTAVLYFAFGVGALVVSLLMILPVALVSKSRLCRVKRVRRINRLAFNAFTNSGVLLGVFDVSFIGAERLNQPGQLILANHPSLLDVVFLLGRIPNASCVVKNKLLINPFLAIPVYFAGYIRNDDGEVLLHNCVASLERGESVIIFPEGTRTIGSQDSRFKRGAAYLMLRSSCPVRPVFISCEPSALGKKAPWYAIPKRKINYLFTVMAELDMTSVRQTEQNKLSLKSRWLTKWLAEWYRAARLDGPRGAPAKIRIPPGPPEKRWLTNPRIGRSAA